MSRPRFERSRAWAGSVAIACAVLAGCGGRRGGGPPDPPDPTVDPCTGNPFTPIPAAEGTGNVDPAATAAQETALDIVNGLRLPAGAPPVNLDAAIDGATTNHARYYVSNPSAYAAGLSAHQEDPAYPSGYTGVNFWDRMAFTGYTGSAAFEVMHFVNDPTTAIAGWMASVYHRTPFVAPTTLDIGYGGDGGLGRAADVMDFGCCRSVPASTTILYPYHDQTDVPPSFDGREGPAPPAPPTGWPSGTVVSVSFAARDWTIGAHAIYDSICAPLDHVASAGPNADPGFDSTLLPRIFFLYPYQPLAGGATYTVEVEGSAAGSAFVRTWRFHTAP